MRVCVPALHETTMDNEPCICCPRHAFVSQNRFIAQVKMCLCLPPSCRSRMWMTGGRTTQNVPCARALAAAAAAADESVLNGHALLGLSFAFSWLQSFVSNKQIPLREMQKHNDERVKRPKAAACWSEPEPPRSIRPKQNEKANLRRNPAARCPRLGPLRKCQGGYSGWRNSPWRQQRRRCG
jgi:hypothetical protein